MKELKRQKRHRTINSSLYRSNHSYIIHIDVWIKMKSLSLFALALYWKLLDLGKCNFTLKGNTENTTKKYRYLWSIPLFSLTG